MAIACLVYLAYAQRLRDGGSKLYGLQVVIRTAVQLAQAEQKHEPGTLPLVSVFGLNIEREYPVSINLYSAIKRSTCQPRRKAKDNAVWAS